MARARTTKARKGGGKPPLGWITPKKRTPEQHAAHYAAVSHMPKFTIQNLTAPGGPVKVILTDFWRKKEIVDAIGREFTGFHQLTGSCVGASGGNFIATLSFIQFFLSDSPTKPFVPWWPFSYGRTRFNEGDRGQGEGAIDSVLLQTFKREGVYGIEEVDDEPQFDTSDGFTLTNRVELQYSDGAAAVVTKYLSLGAKHPLGTAAPISDTTQMRDAIVNGYPVIDGCDNFIGHGSIKGDGENAYVTGKYDGRGGHSTCFLGYWDHPNDGPLFLYSNQWPAQTYPKDPAGGGRCTVWAPESEVAKLFRTGGQGETFAGSHLSYFPAQPKVLALSDIV